MVKKGQNCTQMKKTIKLSSLSEGLRSEVKKHMKHGRVKLSNLPKKLTSLIRENYIINDFYSMPQNKKLADNYLNDGGGFGQHWEWHDIFLDNAGIFENIMSISRDYLPFQLLESLDDMYLCTIDGKKVYDFTKFCIPQEEEENGVSGLNKALNRLQMKLFVVY